MLKKVLSTALCGVSVLGMMAANAAAPGVYVSGQLGYAQTNMKGMTNLNALSKTLEPSFSLTIKDPSDKNLANNGLAGRLAIGYQFNQNFAVELGYLKLGSRQVNVDATKKDETAPITLQDASVKLAQNAIDLAAKGILPIGNNFNVYGKVGLAYLTSNLSINGKADDKKHSYNINEQAGFEKRQWAPEAAIGVSYDITPNVSVDTSWTHIHPIGKNRAGNVNFLAVGLSYNFG